MAAGMINMNKNMQEEICQAHMAGQMDAGVRDPSWSNALAYFNTLEGVREHAPNTPKVETITPCPECSEPQRIESMQRWAWKYCPDCGRKIPVTLLFKIFRS
jgi:DNA-directed RNA polymerase subunit RPC12/RpoP